MPTASALNDATTISLRLALTASAVLLIPLVGFGWKMNSSVQDMKVETVLQLTEIGFELRMLRKEASAHVVAGHHPGVMLRSDFKNFGEAFKMANKAMVWPEMHFGE